MKTDAGITKNNNIHISPASECRSTYENEILTHEASNLTSIFPLSRLGGWLAEGYSKVGTYYSMVKYSACLQDL